MNKKLLTAIIFALVAVSLIGVTIVFAANYQFSLDDISVDYDGEYHGLSLDDIEDALSGDIDDYEIEYYTDEDGWTDVIPQFKDAGTYHVKVKATNESGDVYEARPDITIKPLGITLKGYTFTKTYGEDFDLEYRVYGNPQLVDGDTLNGIRVYLKPDNRNVGNHKVMITDEGDNPNYDITTDRTAHIDILPLEIDDNYEIELSFDEVEYSQDEDDLKPTVKVLYSGEEIDSDEYKVEYEDYDHVGTATVRITDAKTGSENEYDVIGNYTLAEKTAIYEIIAQEVSPVTVVLLSGDTYEYNGHPIEPAVKVIDNDGNEIPSDEYEVTYTDNEQPGEATITVTDVADYGDYEFDETEAKFDIIEINKDVEINITEGSGEYTYTGEEIKPAIEVVYGGTIYSEDDYEVNYESNINVGEATITVNSLLSHIIFSGDTTFTIVPKDVTVAPEDNTKVYGDADPELTCVIEGLVGNDTELEGLEVSRESGENVGNYEITAVHDDTLDTNYSVTILNTANFEITQATLDVTVQADSKVYGSGDPDEFKYEAEGLVSGDTLEEIGVFISRESGENVGEYSYVISTDSSNPKSSNYIVRTTNAAKFEITPKPITVEVADAEKVYKEADPDFFEYVAIEGLVGSDTLEGLSELTRESGEDVGEYAITGTHDDTLDTNYTVTVVPGIFTITPKTITPIVTVDAESGDIVFNKNPQEPALIVTDESGEVIPSGEYEVTYTNNIYAGEATATVTDAKTSSGDTGNYNIVEVAVNFTIEQKEINVNAQNAEKYYGDEDPEFEYSGDALLSGDTLESIGVAITRESGEVVGDYNVSITYDTNNEYGKNYHVILTGGAIFTINPRPITIKPEDNSKYYKDEDPELTYVDPIENIVSGDTIEGIVLSRVSGEEVGEYEITVEVTGENPNYTISGDTGVFTILPREVEPTVEVESGEYIYNGGEITPNVIVKDDSGDIIPSGEYEVTYTNNVNAGTATVTVKDAKTESGDTGNYTLEDATATFEIQRKDLVVTAKDTTKVYGEEDPEIEFTAEELASGDTLEEVGVKLTRTSGDIEDVGEYGIYIASVGGEKSNNYNISIGAGLGKFFITPRPITIKPEDNSKYYKDEDPELTYVDPIENIVSGDVIEGVVLSRVSGEDVGEYEITVEVTGENPNYTISGDTGVFTILPREVEPTVEVESGEFIYNGAEHTPEVVVKDDSGDVIPAEEYEVEYTENVNAGTATVTVKDAKTESGDTGNYTITEATATFEISKAELKVTVDSQEKVYGEEDPELTCTTEGLASGDSLEALGITVERESGENVGDYDIKLKFTGDVIANYTAELTGTATFTINPKEVKVVVDDKTKEYGDEDPEWTYGPIEGLVDGDTIEGIVLDREKGEEAGTYAITASIMSEGNSNYLISSEDGTLTINPKEIASATVEVEKEKYQYTGKEITPEVVVKDENGNIIPADEYVVVYENNKDKGTATVKVEDKEGGNFTVPSASTTFEIYKKTSGGGSSSSGSSGSSSNSKPIEKDSKKPWGNASKWAIPELEDADKLGLIPASLDGKNFLNQITRKEFAAVAVKLYEAITGKKAEPASNNPFIDTKDENVLKAYNLGITKGTSETTFSPNREITREQISTMILRALVAAKIDVSKLDLDDLKKFDDDEYIHDYARFAVYYLASHDIIKGIGDNIFSPLTNSTVEQAIVIALRCYYTWGK